MLNKDCNYTDNKNAKDYHYSDNKNGKDVNLVLKNELID